MTLPTDRDARNALPVWDGCIAYFPDTWAEIAKVSVLGNKQHGLGAKLRFARDVSTDHANKVMRHMLDHAAGRIMDEDGTYHLAKAAWRALAALQVAIEKNSTAVKPPGAAIGPPPATTGSLTTPGSYRDEGELLYATPKLILKLESDDPDTVGECNGKADNQDPQRNTDEELRAAGSAISDRGQVARQECFEQSVRERKPGRKG